MNTERELCQICGKSKPFGSNLCALCVAERAAEFKLQEKGGANDIWHVVQKHNHGDGDISYEIINYARHEKIYLHDATKLRADLLCTHLNAIKY